MPVQSKPSKPVKAAQVNKAGGGPVPYEVFLLVVEALIAGAEACQQPLSFWLYYQSRVPSKLAVVLSQNEADTMNKPLAPLKTRFRSVMLASQVSTKTRALVHNKFVRVPLAEAGNETLAPVQAWVIPHLDMIMMMPLITGFSAPWEISGFIQAVAIPTPVGHAMLQHVQHLYLPSLACLDKKYYNILSILMKLPNLRNIFVSIGRYNKKNFVEASVDGGLVTVDTDTFPDMAYLWSSGTANSLHKRWRPYKEKGIKLYGVANADLETVMRLVPEEGDVLVELYCPQERHHVAEEASLAGELLNITQSLALGEDN